MAAGRLQLVYMYNIICIGQDMVMSTLIVLQLAHFGGLPWVIVRSD